MSNSLNPSSCKLGHISRCSKSSDATSGRLPSHWSHGLSCWRSTSGHRVFGKQGTMESSQSSSAYSWLAAPTSQCERNVTASQPACLACRLSISAVRGQAHKIAARCWVAGTVTTWWGVAKSALVTIGAKALAGTLPGRAVCGKNQPAQLSHHRNQGCCQ